MKYLEMQNRVRSLTRDFNHSIFRSEDVKFFLNEGIDRCKQIVKMFAPMEYLTGDSDVPIMLPSEYHSLLPLYASARLFAQDDRTAQATTLMNEFELKLSELLTDIMNGEVTILDANGEVASFVVNMDEVYVERGQNYSDIDDGVEGLE